MEWIKHFLNYYLNGQRTEAYDLKHNNIPSKLYKFFALDDKRLNSLLRNEVWFSTPSLLNDPYDCSGMYWDEDEISNFFNHMLPADTLRKYSTNEIVYGAVNSLREHVRISCFSEELFNMPMWAHYANNHQGVCVEYNFRDLSLENKFSKYLFPVGYEENRYNITNLIKLSFQEQLDMRMYLLFFLMQIKHKSWGYEKEWRIILNTDTKESGLIRCPTNPTAIYFGLNCSNYRSIARMVKEVFDCPLYKLTHPNTKFFELEPVSI